MLPNGEVLGGISRDKKIEKIRNKDKSNSWKQEVLHKLMAYVRELY